MPYVTLTYADGTQELITTDGEPRVDVESGRSIAFHTTLGLVSATVSDERPAKDEPEPEEEAPAEEETPTSRPKRKRATAKAKK